MAGIVVTDEQARAILAADELLAVRDQAGNVIAYISPPVKQENVESIERLLERRRAEKCRTTDEVFEHLRQLGQDQLDGRVHSKRRLEDRNQPPSSEAETT